MNKEYTTVQISGTHYVFETEFLAHMRAEQVENQSLKNKISALKEELAAKDEVLVKVSAKRPFGEDDNRAGTMNDGWEIAAQFARNVLAAFRSNK